MIFHVLTIHLTIIQLLVSASEVKNGNKTILKTTDLLPLKSNAILIPQLTTMNQHVPKLLPINCAKSCPKNLYGTCIVPFQPGSRYFYRCVEGEPLIASCFPGMIYSPQHQKCLPMFQTPTVANLVPPVVDSSNAEITPPAKLDQLIQFLDLNTQIVSLVELVNIALQKFDRIEKKIDIFEKNFEQMNRFILQAIHETALVCKSKLNLEINKPNYQNIPFHHLKNITENITSNDAFQAMLDEKLFEAFNAEDSLGATKIQDNKQDDQKQEEKPDKQNQELNESEKIIGPTNSEPDLKTENSEISRKEIRPDEMNEFNGNAKIYSKRRKGTLTEDIIRRIRMMLEDSNMQRDKVNH